MLRRRGKWAGDNGAAASCGPPYRRCFRVRGAVSARLAEAAHHRQSGQRSFPNLCRLRGPRCCWLPLPGSRCARARRCTGRRASQPARPHHGDGVAPSGAIHKHHHQAGLGTVLLRDALTRILQAAEIAGVAALLVRVISEVAERLYRSRGFVESPVKPMTMCLILESARMAIKDAPYAFRVVHKTKGPPTEDGPRYLILRKPDSGRQQLRAPSYKLWSDRHVLRCDQVPQQGTNKVLLGLPGLFRL